MIFKALDAKDAKHRFDEILEIESIYSEESNLKRVLQTCFRANNRVCLAFDNDILVGHYIFGPAQRFLAHPKWIEFRSQLVVDIDLCCIPLFSHFLPEYATEKNFIEFNTFRVDDARYVGYQYGIVGLNSNVNPQRDDACLERPWMLNSKSLEDAAQANITLLPYKNYHGDNVRLQHY